MKHFYSASDVSDIEFFLDKIRSYKEDPFGQRNLGENKTIVLLFFNPSLRTRISTHKAAVNLGMEVINLNMKDAWSWELEDGSTMKFNTAEHIREAAGVLSRYADIIGVRSFPNLKDKDEDMKDRLITTLMEYSNVPVVNLESTIRHPLQSATDLYTMSEYAKENPKIVLTWAPHPKALPQAVASSFLEWMNKAGHQVVVTHPKGYDLDSQFMKGHVVEQSQDRALESADFVYVKNWSASDPYGQVLETSSDWMLTIQKLSLTQDAKVMHCLPVRRNVVISDDVLDGPNAIVLQQAENRIYSAQAVLSTLLSSM